MTNAIMQDKRLEAIERKGGRTYKKRVTSALQAWQAEDIMDSFFAGRGAHQIAHEHSCAVALVLELVLRRHQKWLEQIDIRPTTPAGAVRPIPIRPSWPSARQVVTALRKGVA